MTQATCFECGKSAHHAHHVVPKSKGGTRTIPLCRKCHGKVHNRNFECHSELTKKGVERAAKNGRKGGRHRVLSEEDLPKLQALMRDPEVPVLRICERFGISKATLYRYVGPNGDIRADFE